MYNLVHIYGYNLLVFQLNHLLYIQHYQPFDKAGAYAIQGLAAAFIQHIEGSFSGVMGLPIYETMDLLKAFGVDVTMNWHLQS